MLPDVPALARPFDYAIPAALDPLVTVGTRVRVELHGRKVGGWVVRVPGDLSGRELRAIAGWAGLGPPPEVIDLAGWAAWRWAGAVTTFLRTSSPHRIVRALPRPPAWSEWVERAQTKDSTPPSLRSAMNESFDSAASPTTMRLPPAMDLLPVLAEVIGRVGTTRPQRRSVLVLVPSRGWADRLAARLRRRGVPVASRWEEEAAGWPVVIGTRSAAWSPVPEVAAIVVLDAHDEAYREQRAPTWTAWEVAIERARRAGVPCLLVSPCPPVALLERTSLRRIDRSVERAGWCRFLVVDRRGADPRTGLLSDELVATARRQLEAGQRVVCVLNRKGRARLLACASCGELTRCEHCGRSLYLAQERLRCSGCGTSRPQVCAGCGSTALRTLRSGVSRVREELEALLKVPVAEVAASQVQSAECFADYEVMVGTEAALHRVRHAGLVAFLDFDQHLLAPRFGASEESAVLLARASRLVGGRGTVRGDPSPSVLVQTRLARHEVLMAAVRGDPEILARSEMALRRQLGLPPAAAMALVSGAEASSYLREVEQAAGTGDLVSTDLGDQRFLVRAPNTEALCDALWRVRRPRGRLRVEVDAVAV